MSEEWKQYRPKLPIYEVLTKPGGISAANAMKRADAAVEKHRDEATYALTDALTKLDSLARGRNADAAQFYELSTFILDIAGIFQPPLCRAANSLCDLTHRMRAADRWDWPSIDVHLASMRLLAGKLDDKEPSVQTVLNGLGAVVSRFPDPSPPDPPRPQPAS